MSLPIITTAQVLQTITAQLEASFGQAIPIFGKAFARVIAKVLAGVVVILYKYIGFIALQKFVRWASMDETLINGKQLRPLVEWGRLIGVGDPRAATAAEIIVAVTVTQQTGTLPAYSKLVRSESNVVYEVAFVKDLNAPVISATIRPTSDQSGGDGSGTIGNLQFGDVVSFAQPLPNILRDAAVLYSTITGADAETPDEYRARVLKRFQAQPQGGAYADYRTWGLETAGIVNVYPYAGAPGEVDVYVEATPASSGNADGVPTPDQLKAVEALIESDGDSLSSDLPNRRPVGAAVNMFGIYRTPFDVTVTNLVPNDSAIKAQITDALTSYFLEREPYIEGLSVRPLNNLITLAAVGGVAQEVIDANGASASAITLYEYTATTTARRLTKGEKAKLKLPVIFT